MSLVHLTDTEIMTALCCGTECRTETGVCHRTDFITEAARVRAMLEKKSTEPTLIILETETDHDV